MSNCLSCEAAMSVDEAEVGDILVCEQCGTEHEVVSLEPVELILLEDDEEEDDETGAAGKGSDDDEEEEGDRENDYDDDFSANGA